MRNQERFDRVSKALEWPMAILALAVVPALISEARATDLAVLRVARAVNWIVWIAFVLDFGVKLGLAPHRAAFARRSWFDLLIIALSPPFLVPDAWQATRSVRAARLLRVVRLVRAGAVASLGVRALGRALGRHRFHYVLLLALLVLALGAAGILAVEGDTHPGIHSFPDALWWAVVTSTTVGYGDISPQTIEGRAIAVLLMLVGIGVIGIFTANVASFFFDQQKAGEFDRLEARLARIEEKLDTLDTLSERRFPPSKESP